MLIGIDASRANRSHKSGTEWYSYHMIRALAALDSTNQYILYSDTPLGGGLADLRVEGDESFAQPTVDAHGFQKLKSPHNNFQGKVLAWPLAFFWTQGRLALEMLFHRPDILFVPAHALPIIHPKKSVVTIHDIGFRSDPHLYEKLRLGAESQRRHTILNAVIRVGSFGRYGANSFDYLEWSTRYSLAHAQQIVAISNFTKQELIDTYKTPAEKITVIYNGYAKKFYHPLPETPESLQIIARHGITTPYIFYVGRLDKKKNITTLIEAFARLKQVHGSDLVHRLCLVGDASFGFDEIKYTIHQYGLSNQVLLTGWVAEEDLAHIFARATAFIFPSNYEGFGIPLLQAMATNTPIIASRAASIPEVVGEAAVLFDPKDPQAMAEAIAEVIFDKKNQERLIAAGQERIKHFSWEQAAQELLKLFTK